MDVAIPLFRYIGYMLYSIIYNSSWVSPKRLKSFDCRFIVLRNQEYSSYICVYFSLADSREIVALTLYNISSFIEFGYYAFPAEALVTEVS